MKKICLQVGVGLIVGVGALLVAAPQVQAGPPCPKDNCHTYSSPNCAALWNNETYTYMTLMTCTGTAYPGDVVRDYNRLCRDCDGELEGADGHSPGVCMKNMMTFNTLYFDADTACWDPFGSPTVYGELKNCWKKYDVIKGEACQ